MRGKKWTILFVAGEDTSVRQFSLSERKLRWIAGGLGSLLVVLAVLLGLNGLGGAAWVRASQLARTNSLLEAELSSIRAQVSSLDSELLRLASQDQEYRLLAGLDPIDAEVLEVGVGGPGTSDPASHPLWSADSTASKELFTVSYDLNALERRARLLSESLSQATDSLQAYHDLLQSVPSILPADGMVSSSFSKARRHPIHNEVLPHKGVDLVAPKGSPITAAANGVVEFAGRMTGYGLVVVINHGYGYETRYGHASELLVRKGQTVSRGDVIALVGNTGLATASHLHYEVRVNGTPVNPMDYVMDAIP
ncbi:MAG: M23 family metallopeptidase [Gemmatimonadota bacterium]